MIQNYEPPSISFTTNFQTVASPVSNTRTACAVGPNYRLSRFNKDYGTSTPTMGDTFLAAGQTVPYRYLNASTPTVKPVDEVVDYGFSKLFGEGLEAELASIVVADSQYATVPSLAESNILQANTAVFAGTGTLITKLRGRPVAIGDIVSVTGAGVTNKRRVVGMRGVATAASFGSDVSVSDATPAGASANPSTTTLTTTGVVVPAGADEDAVTVTAATGFVNGSLVGTYRNGKFAELFTLTVTSAGVIGSTLPTVAVTSASGLYSGSITAVETSGDFVFASVDPTIMAGITVTLDLSAWFPVVGQLDVGQVIQFEVTAPYTRLTTGDAAGTAMVRPGVGSAYVGTRNTNFVIEVVTGTYHATTPTATGAVIRITDTAGLYGTTTATLTDAAATPLAASGLSIVFDLTTAVAIPQRGLRKGDRYSISAIAASESSVSFDKLILDGPAIDSTLFTNFATHLDVSVRVPYTGEVQRTASTDTTAWSAQSTGAVVDPGLSLYIAERSAGYNWVPFVNSVGRLYQSWRSLIPPTARESIITVTSTAQVQTLLGVIDPDNDLAYAASMILAGGSGSAYVLRTTDETAGAYTTALGKIARQPVEYIVTTTDNADVRDALRSHLVEANAPSREMFREGWVGASSPGRRSVLSSVNGSPLIGTVTSYSGNNILVTLTNPGVDITPLNLHAGDIVTVQGVDYTFGSQLSPTELLLTAGPMAPVTPATSIVISKANTSANNVEALVANAIAMSSEYVRLAWTEGARTAAGVDLPARYVAAYLAGLRTATVTQRGLSGASIPIVSSAVSTFMNYTDAQLNEIAAAGVTIVGQITEGSPVTVRHALTTRTDNGALSYEEMVVTNTLRIARRLTAVTLPYKGRRNVNRQTLIELQDRWTATLSDETKLNPADPEIGPALIGFDPVTVTIGSLKDRFAITANTFQPLPANHIDGFLNVSQASNNDILPEAPVVS